MTIAKRIEASLRSLKTPRKIAVKAASTKEAANHILGVLKRSGLKVKASSDFDVEEDIIEFYVTLGGILCTMSFSPKAISHRDVEVLVKFYLSNFDNEFFRVLSSAKELQEESQDGRVICKEASNNSSLSDASHTIGVLGERARLVEDICEDIRVSAERLGAAYKDFGKLSKALEALSKDQNHFIRFDTAD